MVGTAGKGLLEMRIRPSSLARATHTERKINKRDACGIKKRKEEEKEEKRHCGCWVQSVSFENDVTLYFITRFS